MNQHIRALQTLGPASMTNIVAVADLTVYFGFTSTNPEDTGKVVVTMEGRSELYVVEGSNKALWAAGRLLVETLEANAEVQALYALATPLQPKSLEFKDFRFIP